MERLGSMIGRVVAALAAVAVVEVAAFLWLPPAAASWSRLLSTGIAVGVAASLLWRLDTVNVPAFAAAGLLAVAPVAVHALVRDAGLTISAASDTCRVVSVDRSTHQDAIPATSVLHRLDCAAAGSLRMLLDGDVARAGDQLEVQYRPGSGVDVRPASGSAAPRPLLWAIVVLLVSGGAVVAVGRRPRPAPAGGGGGAFSRA